MMAEKTTEQQIVNDFDSIDYKRQIGKADDTRTSTYRAHHYLNDTNMRNTIKAKLTPSKTYEVDHLLERSRISDYQDNYLWPRLDTGKIANPKLGFKHQFIKTFDERKLKFLKRPLRLPASTTHQAYTWNPVKSLPSPTAITFPNPISITKISISRCTPGFAKYMDPSATTTRLDYCALSPTELSRSIARHDNINYWTWSKTNPPTCRVTAGSDGNLCNDAPANSCGKKGSDFPSLVKHVPHSGLTTEIRDNYLKPLARPNYRVYDTSQIRNIMIHSKALPSPNETDYRLLTSGERVQKHV